MPGREKRLFSEKKLDNHFLQNSEMRCIKNANYKPKELISFLFRKFLGY